MHVFVVCAYITTHVQYCHEWIIRSESVYRCVTTAHAPALYCFSAQSALHVYSLNKEGCTVHIPTNSSHSHFNLSTLCTLLSTPSSQLHATTHYVHPCLKNIVINIPHPRIQCLQLLQTHSYTPCKCTAEVAGDPTRLSRRLHALHLS